MTVLLEIESNRTIIMIILICQIYYYFLSGLIGKCCDNTNDYIVVVIAIAVNGLMIENGLE